MVDPESSSATWLREMKGKGRARFGHAGETVRAYVAENALRLVAVVSASRDGVHGDMSDDEEGEEGSDDAGEGMDSDWSPDSPDTAMIEDSADDARPAAGPPDALGISLFQHSTSSTVIERLPPNPSTHLFSTPTGLLATDESALLSLYRSNVLEPLAVIREFQDLLALPSHPDGRRGRVVFVNSPPTANGRGDTGARREAAMGVIQAARAETARALRVEMGEMGVEVCEVAVGESCQTS